MADVKEVLPGTWLARVLDLRGNLLGLAIATYTSDGGMIERVSGQVEGAIGAWEPVDDRDDAFRFVFYRYEHDLPGAPNPGDPNVINKLSATCQMTDSNKFACAITAEKLDKNGTLITAQSAAHFRLESERMKIEPAQFGLASLPS
jgi:hypothetical protein